MDCPYFCHCEAWPIGRLPSDHNWIARYHWRPRGDRLFPTCRRKRSKQIPSPTKTPMMILETCFHAYQVTIIRLQTPLQMVWCFCTEGSWGWEHTLPKTEIFSENRPFPKGKQSLNSHFSETMLVVGRIISFSKCFNRKLPKFPKDRIVLLPHGLFLMAYKWWLPTTYLQVLEWSSK